MNDHMQAMRETFARLEKRTTTLANHAREMNTNQLFITLRESYRLEEQAEEQFGLVDEECRASTHIEQELMRRIQ